MADLYAQVLRQIITQHGQAVCADPRRLKGLLADYLGNHPGVHDQPINVLLMAVTNRVVQDLTASDALPAEMVRQRIADRLRSQLGLTEQAAAWAVAAWSAALQPQAAPVLTPAAPTQHVGAPQPGTQPMANPPLSTRPEPFASVTQPLDASPAAPATRRPLVLAAVGGVGGMMLAAAAYWLIGQAGDAPTSSTATPVAPGDYDALVQSLQSRMEAATTAGQLDQAMALRKRLERLQGDDNLLVNGSFEDTTLGRIGAYTTLAAGAQDIRGWTVTHGQVDLNGDFWQNAQGRHSIDLNGDVRGGLRQTFATEVGLKYRVRFSFAGNPGGFGPGFKKMGVRAASQTAEFVAHTTGRSNADMGWITKTWDFTAEAEETTLQFYSMTDDDGNSGPALDDVVVTVIRPR